MAVPGSVLSGRNRGSHALLKDGAKVVESADDILEELARAPGRAVAAGREAGSAPTTRCSGHGARARPTISTRWRRRRASIA